MHSDKLNMAYHRPPKQPNDTKSLTHLPCNNHYPLSKGENGKRTIKFMVLALQKLILKDNISTKKIPAWSKQLPKQNGRPYLPAGKLFSSFLVTGSTNKCLRFSNCLTVFFVL